MNAKIFGNAVRSRGIGRWWLAALLMLGMAQAAHADWTARDALIAFDDYNKAFYFTPDGDDYDYRVQQGMTDPTYFWVAAEEIELAIDAYDHYPSPARATIVTQLCNGFIARYGDSWGSDTYDDDLMWATIAFVRAYNVTGNKQLLRDARENFETVWSRGYDSSYGGGIWENVADKDYKASAANWTFVIAGHLLYRATGDSTYRRQAGTVYAWAFTHLYDAATGEVFDDYSAQGQNKRQFSYNYGTAVGAMFFQDDARAATSAARYLTRNLSSGKTFRGFNVMPLYGEGNKASDGSGFNGIALRWIGRAYVHGAIHDEAVLRWAQANVAHAWAQRNSQGLSWNDWNAQTPHGTNLYGWNCSDTVVGMLDIPPDARK